ncbi:MAG: hypothetical protein RL634_671, partial [Bacteroidota bacterium]
MGRLQKTFDHKTTGVLNVYFT